MRRNFTLKSESKKFRKMSKACREAVYLPMSLLIIFCSGGTSTNEPTSLESLILPPGFVITEFAQNLGKARGMGVSPAGDLFVCSLTAGEIIVLPDRNSDGKADENIVFAQGLQSPHSVAFYNGYVYVGESDKISRFRDDNNDLIADAAGETVVAGLPTSGHFTKTVAFGPDGMMYVSIGSSCNVCEENDPRRAAVVRYDPDGGGETVFSSGLRNSVALAFHPESGELWAANNGRDRIGDDLPPEEINILSVGKHYGWPYCYGEGIMNPEYVNDPSLCDETIAPIFDMQAHSAPLGMRFYNGGQFPAEYRGDLFIAFHGSWNRSKKTGYKVVRVRVEDGLPVSIEDFVSGWLMPDETRWGRPVDVEISPDGSMFVSDDYQGKVYKITYTGG